LNIGIIGFGILGNAINDVFKDKANIIKSDPKLLNNSANPTRIVLECEFIFICVPTPYSFSNQETDGSIIKTVISEINFLSNKYKKRPIVIIKSTTPPRLVKEFIDTYKDIDIVVNPEYLTEKNSSYDFIHQKFMILGGDHKACKRVSLLFSKYSICNADCKVGYCTAEEASLLKYMANSMLAVKNIFLNQFKEYYDKYFNLKDDSKYNDFLKLFHLDHRMGNVYINKKDYTIPGHDGDIGYGGKCLPKDLNSMISEGNKLNVNFTLLTETEKYNQKIRTYKDWISIDGAFIN